ncbi:MAG: hypothetical protein AAFY99_12280 [Pseudomonadota bacterium]
MTEDTVLDTKIKKFILVSAWENLYDNDMLNNGPEINSDDILQNEITPMLFRQISGLDEIPIEAESSKFYNHYSDSIKNSQLDFDKIVDQSGDPIEATEKYEMLKDARLFYNEFHLDPAFEKYDYKTSDGHEGAGVIDPEMERLKVAKTITEADKMAKSIGRVYNEGSSEYNNYDYTLISEGDPLQYARDEIDRLNAKGMELAVSEKAPLTAGLTAVVAAPTAEEITNMDPEERKATGQGLFDDLMSQLAGQGNSMAQAVLNESASDGAAESGDLDRKRPANAAGLDTSLDEGRNVRARTDGAGLG